MKRYFGLFLGAFVVLGFAQSPKRDLTLNHYRHFGTWLDMRNETAAVEMAAGKILVAGGVGEDDKALKAVEVFNTATDRWELLRSLQTARANHGLFRLNDSRIVAVGGYEDQVDGKALASSEIFDPQYNKWMEGPSLTEPLGRVTGLHLRDGRIFLAGGKNLDGSPSASCYLLDTSARAWVRLPDLNLGRVFHTLIEMPSGEIVALGGQTSASPSTDSVEIFSFRTNSWTQAAALPSAIKFHGAVLLNDGRVLIGGGSVGGNLNFPGPFVTSGMVGDPIQGLWKQTGPMQAPRTFHVLGKLADGRVVLSGGNSKTCWGCTDITSEVYDPGTNEWKSSPNLDQARLLPLTLRDSSGGIWAIGGEYTDKASQLRSLARLDEATLAWVPRGTREGPVGKNGATAVPLPNGDVMFVGGSDHFYGNDVSDYSYQVYRTKENRWEKPVSMPLASQSALDVALPSGRRLIAGNWDARQGEGRKFKNRPRSVNTYLVDPVSEMVINGPAMLESRVDFVLAPTPKGAIAIGGNYVERKTRNRGELNAEVYVESENTWKPFPLNFGDQVGELWGVAGLPSDQGNVFLFGGRILETGQVLNSAYEVNLESGVVTKLAPMQIARRLASVVKLLDGRYMVLGGLDSSNESTNSTEIYDPATNTWTFGASYEFSRVRPEVKVLATGKVVLAGGYIKDSGLIPRQEIEVFDPAMGTWSMLGRQLRPCREVAVSQISDGRLMLFGGVGLGRICSEYSFIAETR